MAHTLLLMRHAKADGSAPGRTDHQRPLTEAGVAQAAAARERLLELGLPVGHALCSTAARARQTLDEVLLAGGYGESGALIPGLTPEFSDAIYNASPEEIARVIADVDEGVDTLLVLGHSPGIPGLAAELGGTDSDPGLLRQLERDFPTATIAQLEIEGSWQDPGPGRLVRLIVTRA